MNLYISYSKSLCQTTGSGTDNRQRELEEVIKRGDIEAVKRLLCPGEVPVGVNLNKLLQLAIENEYVKIVVYLLEKGAEVKNDHQHILSATELGNFEIVQLLLESGACPWACANKTLMNAAGIGSVGIIELLISFGANFSHLSKYQAFQRAMEKNHADLMWVLLSDDKGVHITDDQIDQALKKRNITAPKAQAKAVLKRVINTDDMCLQSMCIRSIRQYVVKSTASIWVLNSLQDLIIPKKLKEKILRCGR